jgi:chromosome segregation ATPase
MSFDLFETQYRLSSLLEEHQDLKKEYEALQDLYKANVKAYNVQSNELKAAQERIKQQEELISVLNARIDKALYRNRRMIAEASKKQEQIETLRFDNEHLQKDIAEKDLQIAALKDKLAKYGEPFAWIPIRMFKDKPDNLEKEKEYWKDAAKNARKDVAHWQTKAERLMEDRQNEPYWKAQAANLRRENAAYKKLLEPILEYAQTLSKT